MNDGKAFAVRGLSLCGKTLDIEITGTGTKAKFCLNGRTLEDGFVPWNMLKEKHNLLSIEVEGR
jgi:hypothetical protein